MSTVSDISATQSPRPYERDGRNEEETEYSWWREHSRVVISPIASPSAMGLYGFSAATLIVAGNLAGWYGPATHSGLYYAPFCLAFGGIAQFLAGMWCYKARDTIGTVAHSMWGTFWIGYGILWLMVGAKALPLPAGAKSGHWVTFGMWFVMLGLLTMGCAFAAIAKNIALFVTLALLAAGSDLLAAGMIGGFHTTVIVGGWVLVASVGAAVYTATALMVTDSYGRTILPLGKFKKDANVPGRVIAHPIEYTAGMPGARVGQ
ncbi:MAG: acetate uptake transporter [Gemmatimonadaceae bacterium]